MLGIGPLHGDTYDGHETVFASMKIGQALQDVRSLELLSIRLNRLKHLLEGPANLAHCIEGKTVVLRSAVRGGVALEYCPRAKRRRRHSVACVVSLQTNSRLRAIGDLDAVDQKVGALAVCAGKFGLGELCHQVLGEPGTITVVRSRSSDCRCPK